MARAKKTMSYPLTMSDWETEPSSSERWTARHRTQVRVAAVLMIVLAIWRIAYLLTTGGPLDWSLGGSIGLITSPCVIFFLSWSASRHVERYDEAHLQGPE
jgi:succinate dehydrogenase hydrophobic anchor subunit